MERHLTLVRHAKSSWKDALLDDFDRPLNARGQRDAPLMGRRLLARGARPSLILTSPALRARKTAAIFAAELGYPKEFLQCEQALYLAEADTLLDILARQDDDFRELLICGHNPGLTELANRLLSEGHIDNLPTCAVLTLTMELEHWAELPGQRGKISFFDTPHRVAG